MNSCVAISTFFHLLVSQSRCVRVCVCACVRACVYDVCGLGLVVAERVKFCLPIKRARLRLRLSGMLIWMGGRLRLGLDLVTTGDIIVSGARLLDGVGDEGGCDFGLDALRLLLLLREGVGVRCRATGVRLRLLSRPRALPLLCAVLLLLSWTVVVLGECGLV